MFEDVLRHCASQVSTRDERYKGGFKLVCANLRNLRGHQMDGLRQSTSHSFPHFHSSVFLSLTFILHILFNRRHQCLGMHEEYGFTSRDTNVHQALGRVCE